MTPTLVGLAEIRDAAERLDGVVVRTPLLPSPGLAEETGAAEVRLKILGLSEKQIEALKENRPSGENLLLPGKTAWIYGEAYEYEYPWIKAGAAVTVTADGVRLVAQDQA